MVGGHSESCPWWWGALGTLAYDDMVLLLPGRVPPLTPWDPTSHS